VNKPALHHVFNGSAITFQGRGQGEKTSTDKKFLYKKFLWFGASFNGRVVTFADGTHI